MKQDSKIITWVILFLVALLLYPLSAGPIIWLVRAGYLPDADWLLVIFSTVYAPFEWLYENSTWFRKFFEWYHSLWGV